MSQYIREEIQWSTHEDPLKCRCRGGGWSLSDYDVWLKCPAHNIGQKNPEDESGCNQCGSSYDLAWEKFYNALGQIQYKVSGCKACGASALEAYGPRMSADQYYQQQLKIGFDTDTAKKKTMERYTQDECRFLQQGYIIGPCAYSYERRK